MLRPAFAKPTDIDATSVHDYVHTLLDKKEVTRADIVEAYMAKHVPDMAIVFIYLASRNMKAEDVLSDDQMVRFFKEGHAISDYIDHELADDHPTDKRFLLRHMELLCFRYGLNRTTSTGYGHDVIFSRTPIAEHYSKFDNSLYVPPLTGHWAIASKGAARD